MFLIPLVSCKLHSLTEWKKLKKAETGLSKLCSQEGKNIQTPRKAIIFQSFFGSITPADASKTWDLNPWDLSPWDLTPCDLIQWDTSPCDLIQWDLNQWYLSLSLVLI